MSQAITSSGTGKAAGVQEGPDKMPDYSIDPDQHEDYECAFCGAKRDLVEMHIRAAERGGQQTVTGCRSCNSSMRNDTLVDWLRRMKNSDSDFGQDKWDEILDHHWHRRTGLSAVIHRIDYE